MQVSTLGNGRRRWTDQEVHGEDGTLWLVVFYIMVEMTYVFWRFWVYVFWELWDYEMYYDVGGCYKPYVGSWDMIDLDAL